MMLKSISLRRNYDTENRGFCSTLTVNAGDIDLRASLTDDTSFTLPTLETLYVEKPGSFAIDYDLPNKDVRFQFTKKVNVLEKPLNLTYTHTKSENKTALNGTLELNSAHKLSADYAFDFGNCKLKYSYANGGMTLEPSYDFEKKSLDLTMSQRIDGDFIGASYKMSSKVLGLEWSTNCKFNQNLRYKITALLNLEKGVRIPKLSALLNLEKGVRIPKLSAESTWDF